MSKKDKLWEKFFDADEMDRLVQVTRKKPPAGVSRRTFLEALGYSSLALVLGGCRAPQQKIVPYLKQPVEFTPGVASWFASVCGGCSRNCGTLVKVRDGRPIKLEGNPDHPISQGGLCALAHAQVFGLYDPDRLRQPQIGSQAASWNQIDEQVITKLNAIRNNGGKVRILTAPIASPTSREVIQNFLAQFKDGKHISYKAVSDDAIRQAHLRSHGVAAIPRYRFDKARLVVSFGADFLGTWVSPVEFTRQYSQARNLQGEQKTMLRHVQFESRLSLTGSNADKRIRVSPGEQTAALLYLVKAVSGEDRSDLSFLSSVQPGELKPETRSTVENLARELMGHKGASLVVCGANDIDAQHLTSLINQSLGNYGETIDLESASSVYQSSDAEFVELVNQMNSGEIAALIISGVNPGYDYSDTHAFTSGLQKVSLKISFNTALDETSSLADYVCPQPHFLEAWDDAEPASGTFSINQPTISPLFQTRPYQETLMRWSGDSRRFYEALRQSWREKLFQQQKQYSDFDSFWDNALQKGFVTAETTSGSFAFKSEGLNEAVARLNSQLANTSGLSLIVYEKTSIRDGRFANNPWLQELPDPITKITWDNYASVSPTFAEQNRIAEGRVVRINNGSTTIELPAHIQPGQADDVVAIALGYGRTKAGRGGSNVGVNAFPFVGFDQTFRYARAGVTVEQTAKHVEFAKTQIKDSQEERRLVRELTLAEYVKGEQEEREHLPSLWSPHDYPEHKWGIAVDLNACVGCNACVISCQGENNIPVVGKDEVRRRREMHWVRIDRYFEGDRENPRVHYQPVMCAQCDNASCESVCPVLATVHSSEGLNMQIYNRCVGTRYCENNCPYKVRRFNWFNYPHDDAVANLALNPDVTVRTRGVMEKCTFCVQRIEDVKITARNEGRAINDGEIQPACAQSCPANAIIFGDLTDVKSRVAQMKNSGRNYTLLEELNLQPALSYLAKVRNDEEAAV
jgi:Fe-S-cluster-containing dehydrogenase component/anaerobic selenocysteine-containing dehydrogenase